MESVWGGSMETPVALGLAFAKKFQAPRTPPRSCSDSVPVLNLGVISFLPSRVGRIGGGG